MYGACANEGGVLISLFCQCKKFLWKTSIGARDLEAKEVLERIRGRKQVIEVLAGEREQPALNITNLSIDYSLDGSTG